MKMGVFGIMEEALLAFRDFSIAADLAVTVIDLTGQTLFESDGFEKANAFGRLASDAFGLDGPCRYARLYAGYQAIRLGGRYIYDDPVGLTFFASPILQQSAHVATAIAGPLLMMQRDEYFEIDMLERYAPTPGLRDILYAALYSVPEITPKRVNALSELLYICAAHSGDGAQADGLRRQREAQQLQSYLHTYISDAKEDAAKRVYPIRKEEELLSAISRGDVFSARALLNELLGHILFQSGQDFEIIRSRIIELIVLLSRAAVKGGADAETIFAMNYEFFQEIEGIHTVDTLTQWLSLVMNRFTDTVFSFADAKHVDVLYRAILFMKANHMQKLTLESVAGHVYLSPTYLSRIFKEETGYNFNTYLNMIRIEESKHLLMDNGIELVQISGMVGYEDQSYFSKVFKKLVGISPGKFRQANYQ